MSKYVTSKDVEKAHRLRKMFARQSKKRVDLFWLSPDNNPDGAIAIFALKDGKRWSLFMEEQKVAQFANNAYNIASINATWQEVLS
jgi:hypothetical protein